MDIGDANTLSLWLGNSKRDGGKKQKDFLLSPFEEVQDGLIQNRGVWEPGLARLFTVAGSSRFRSFPEGSTLSLPVQFAGMAEWLKALAGKLVTVSSITGTHVVARSTDLHK